MSADLPSGRILIVDDSQILNDMLRDIFEVSGFEAYQAFNGLEAKALALKERPDIALIDVNMPDLNGIEVLRFIKEKLPETIVVMMTASGSEETAVKVLKLGADEYLAKPFDTGKVVDLALGLLKHRAAERENVRLRKEIRRTEQYLAHLTRIIKEGLITTDSRGRIELVNHAASTMWGYSEDELRGQDVHLLIHGEARTRAHRDVVKATLEAGNIEGEFHFRKKDRTVFPGYLSTSVIQDKDRPRGIVLVVADLTRQNQVEDKLRQSEKLASLGKVVEGVAHEVRNCLTSLGGFASRLRRITEEDPRAENYTRIILDDVARLESMVRQIEDYVRFSKFYSFQFQKIAVTPLITRAHERVLQLVRVDLAKKVSFRMEAEKELPAVSGDAQALEEVFFNLLMNAYEAMPNGGKLNVRVKGRNSAVSVAVTDTGVGISDDAIYDIFTPFYTSKTSGAGMGLSKVYLLVEEHRGSISVTSEPRKGSTFEVLLPQERFLGNAPGIERTSKGGSVR
ncbi:MAG: response regulator [Thermodesulfobacteriota bacterium]